MNPSLLLSVVLSIASLSAQTVSPSPFKDWPGDSGIQFPFSHDPVLAATQRAQQIHADLTGSPLLVNKMTWRRKSVFTPPVPAAIPPKTMTLKLTLAAAVAPTSATTNWSANYAASGTLVFSGTISTPAAWTTPPRSAPTPFDFALTFSTPFAYAGSGPFLWDCDVTSASTTDLVVLDLAQTTNLPDSYCAYTMYGAGCANPAGELQLRGRGQTLLSAVANEFRIASVTMNAPPGAFVTVLLGSTQLNLPVPGLCTNLYTNELISITGIADPTGAWESPYLTVPYNAAYVGVPLPMQGAALDTSAPIQQLTASNGLLYRAAPKQPALSLAMVVGTTGSATAQRTLSGSATPVLFQ